MGKEVTKAEMEQLYRFFCSVTSPEEFSKVLDDLCTYNEVEQMASRLQSALLLMEGKTYNQVLSEVSISSATLSRVSRCIRHGSGGYNMVLKKWNENKENP